MIDGHSIISVPVSGLLQVRVWEILQGCHRLIETMKEHKATITSIKIKSNDKECVTTSSDGACIIWDLVRFVRNQMVLANTLFSSVCYHPEEYEIITSGTDRKIGYWEVYDVSAIRELEGSLSGAINGMHISQDGQHLVTGGDEKLVKVWDYSRGRGDPRRRRPQRQHHQRQDLHQQQEHGERQCRWGCAPVEVAPPLLSLECLPEARRTESQKTHDPMAFDPHTLQTFYFGT
ncbi:unnamed protein product [Oncorhynchus mykiss]|uniref:Uncharacterized protein n=1 Tax=Oncorhynchus mykiss TaxID=8022 RepID=A0A060WFT6_ONCMY|nr:unnamed protein product [Oncorhynchus mykiss]